MPRTPYLIVKRDANLGTYNVKRPPRRDLVMSLPETLVLTGNSIVSYINGEMGVTPAVGQIRQERIGNRHLHAAPGSQIHDEVIAAANVLIRSNETLVADDGI